jgi:hypothetical protein
MRSSHGLRGNSICPALTDVYGTLAYQKARTRNGSTGMVGINEQPS